MDTDHEVQEIIGKTLAQAKVELPAGDVHQTGKLDDLALTIMNALDDAGFRILRD